MLNIMRGWLLRALVPQGELLISREEFTDLIDDAEAGRMDAAEALAELREDYARLQRERDRLKAEKPMISDAGINKLILQDRDKLRAYTRTLELQLKELRRDIAALTATTCQTADDAADLDILSQ